MALIVISGLLSIPQIPKKFFPDIEIPYVFVSVPYLGAAPEEVERGVCMRIEERLEGIEGIDKISSYSSESMCTVTAELFEYTDPSRAHDEIKNQVDSITTFPKETEKPITNLVNPKRKVLDLTLIGPTGERELKEETMTSTTAMAWEALKVIAASLSLSRSPETAFKVEAVAF